MATIFVGSALLFAVQPMIARMLLPRLGGAPSVWTVSVLFFQSVLLAGYAYAHGTSRRPPAAQLAIHSALLLLALAGLPFHLAAGAPGAGLATRRPRTRTSSMRRATREASWRSARIRSWWSRRWAWPGNGSSGRAATSSTSCSPSPARTALLTVLADRLGATGQAREVLTAGLPALLAYLASNRPLRFGLTVGAVLLAGSLDSGVRGPALLTERSFFGIHRVTRASVPEAGRPAAFHRLYHGSTIHGIQRADVASGAPIDHREPLGYYSIGSPIGWLFRSFPRGVFPRRVGLVGLGAGCLLAYAEPGERWTIFEFDPFVKRIAEDERYFSYLPEARRRGVEAEVVLGDARLTLAPAAGPFDLIVLDAFTSGSIPVHLLTREAFQLYEDRLGPDGLLAFRISNRHLDLAPLMRAMARDCRLAAVIEEDFSPPSPTSPTSPTMGSRWAFLARSADRLPPHGLAPVGPPEAASARVWTDDRSDAWSLFQW